MANKRIYMNGTVGILPIEGDYPPFAAVPGLQLMAFQQEMLSSLREKSFGGRPPEFVMDRLEEAAKPRELPRLVAEDDEQRGPKCVDI